jgi:predicted RNase H-like nuclease
MSLAGIDGCREGWLCLRDDEGIVQGQVFSSFVQMLQHLQDATVIAIDIPIGLPASGERSCDRMARQLLGSPRSTSVFSAPVHGAVSETDYASACTRHRQIDGRALSRQAFAILPKIREVNAPMWLNNSLQQRVKEIHPEVCFAVWNGGRAMEHRKATPEGRRERQRLIDITWPRQRARILGDITHNDFQDDDLNDAFAALWTAKRISAGTAMRLGSQILDPGGLEMEMWA